MADTPSLYSHHIFIFPFRWDFAPCDTAKACFSERTNLEKVLKEMKDSPETRSTKINLTWGRFRFDWTRDFNKAIYFHSFARDALFDNGQPKPGLGLQYSIPGYEEIKTKNETTGKEATERKSKNLEYRISLNDANTCSVYQLEIE